MITFLDGGGPVDPGFGGGLPAGGGRPDNSLPGGGGYPSTGPIYGGGHPGNALPGGGHIALLPVFPFDPTDPGFGVGGGRPDNSLPGSGGRPDNSLPGSGGRPDQGLPGSGGRPDNSLPHPGIVPGAKFVVKWLACQGLILVPDNSLPGGAPSRPDNSLPDSAAPKK
jgi:hypothetical protein